MKYKCDCTSVHHCKVPCYAEVDGFTPERCLFSDTRKAKWEPVTDCNLLPKLTAEVFDHPDCPTWAKYAAVDKYGQARYYSSCPVHTSTHWLNKGLNWQYIQENHQCVHFDAYDWQNSLIERPAKLPYWCKCGELAYGEGRYGRITAICHTSGKIDIGETGHFIPVAECAEARLRPWTFEEAPLSLKVKDPHGFALAYLSPFGGKYIIAYHEHEECEKLKSGEVTFTLSAFADIFTQIDGSPCGVLEHLNGKGEWVE